MKTDKADPGQDKRALVESWMREAWDIEPLPHPKWMIKATHRQSKNIITVLPSVDHPDVVLINAVIDIKPSEREKLDRATPETRAATLRHVRAMFAKEAGDLVVNGLPGGPDHLLHQLVFMQPCRGDLSKKEFLHSVDLIMDTITLTRALEFRPPPSAPH